MVSFAIHKTLRAAGRILMLAVVAAPSMGFSQRAAEGPRPIDENFEQAQLQNALLPELAPLASDEQQQIVEKLVDEIQAMQLEEGSNSPGLIDPLTALALLYQEDGDHDPASAVIETARHVIHVNYGLYSLEETPLMRQLIRSEDARGNVEAAWNLEQALLNVAERHRPDLRTVPILREIADDRMDLLKRYHAGEAPPEIILGCYYDREPLNGIDGCYAGSSGAVVRAIYSEARSYYMDAIDVILQNELYSSDELEELEMEVVRNSYQYGAQESGRDSLRRRLDYQVANSAPLLIRVNTRVQMADWDLHYSRSRNVNESTLETYQQIYELLINEEIPQAAIDEIFSPEVPVAIPAFLPNPLASQQSRDFTGHIDVAFELGKYGKSKRIEVLDTTSNATRAAQRHLAQRILRSRFRPIVKDGLFVDKSQIVARYYLNDPSDLSAN